MKRLSLIMLTVAVLGLAQTAQAFITVINVKDVLGDVIMVQSADDYSVYELYGKQLSYSGRPQEAANLFNAMVNREMGLLAKVSADINEATGTVAITLAVRGFAGTEYYYFILQQVGR